MNKKIGKSVMSNIELSDSIKFISVQQCEQHRECWSEVTCGLCTCLMTDGGPGSIVRIATSYGLDGPGIKSQWGRDFFAPVQTSPGAHRASCTMGTGSFPGVKSGRRMTLTPHPLLVPWS